MQAFGNPTYWYSKTMPIPGLPKFALIKYTYTLAHYGLKVSAKLAIICSISKKKLKKVLYSIKYNKSKPPCEGRLAFYIQSMMLNELDYRHCHLFGVDFDAIL